MALSETGKQLSEALGDAFRTMPHLDVLAYSHVGMGVDEFAGRGHPLKILIFKLVQWAESRGELEKLLKDALEVNGRNPRLMELARVLLPHEAGEAAPLPDGGAGGAAARPADVRVTPAGDFTDGELDQALRAAEAVNPTSPPAAGERLDPAAPLRSILKRPEKFEQYAELLRQGEPRLGQGLTWSRLTELYLERDLERVSQTYLLPAAELRETLTALAALALEREAQDFRLDAEEVRARVPALYRPLGEAGETVCTALVESGVLSLHADEGGDTQVSFRSADVGNYLLSFVLERQAEGRTHGDVSECVSAWVSQSWNYSHLLDALLAWVDRLSAGPESPLLLLLVSGLLQSHAHASLFEQIDPRVIKALLTLIARGEERGYYKYRQAAIALRPSPEMMGAVRAALSDPNPLSRRLAAELAGAHGDKDSISALISLLEDENEGVRREAFGAFGRGRMGKAPVPLLLEALRAPSKSEQVRGRYLVALRSVGFRDEAVSESLGECLTDALRGGGAEYLQSGLLAAAHLRDRAQLPYAFVSLKHADEKVAQAAAKLLTEVPHPAASAPLQEVVAHAPANEDAASRRYWILRQNLAALAASDGEAAGPVLREHLRRSLSGEDGVQSSDVIRLAERFEVAPPHGLLLKELARRLRRAGQGLAVWELSEVLGATWQRGPLDALAAAADELLAGGEDISRLLVDAIAPNMPEHDEFPMGDRLNRVDDLMVAVKSRAANLATEACRLLADAPDLSTAELCRFLWVLGDARAEEALVRKLAAVSQAEPEERYQRSVIVRALGTCGTRRSVETVLSHLRGEGEISIHFYEETLHPMLRRGVLSQGELDGVARDHGASVVGRITALRALAIEDAPGHKELFLAHSSDDEPALLQSAAVQMLGFTGNPSVVPQLRRLLTGSARPPVRARAAEALSRLGTREALGDIHAEFGRRSSAGFINAIARFGDPSSLPLLVRKMRGASFETLPYFYAALAAFAHAPGGRDALREKLEVLLSDEPDYFDQQSHLFRGLLRHDPDLLLEAVLEGNTWARISPGGRRELARAVGSARLESAAGRELVLGAARRLICDREVAVRESALQGLGDAGPAFGQRVYEEIWRDPAADEWSRACAVRSLGYWESDRTALEKIRFAGELIVRHAADEALEVRRRKEELQSHVALVGSNDGRARLSGYMCVKEHGDLGTVRQLKRTIPRQSAQRAFADNLSREVGEKLRNDYRRKQESEDKFIESRGTIWFD